MKNVFLIIVWCASTAYAVDNWKLNGIDEAIQEKCVKNSGNIEAGHQFANALREYTECYLKQVRPNSQSQNTVEELCILMNQNEFQDCLVNYTRNVFVCLDETETYLPELVIRADESRLKYLCSVDGLADAEYFRNIISSDHCLFQNYYYNIHLFTNGSIAADGECISHLSMLQNLDKNILNFNKTNVYNDLQLLKKCWSDLLQRNCDKDYSRYVELQFDPYIKELDNLLSHSSTDGNFSN